MTNACCDRAPHTWKHAPEEREPIFRKGPFASNRRAQRHPPVLALRPEKKPRGMFRLTAHERATRDAQQARKAARREARHQGTAAAA